MNAGKCVMELCNWAMEVGKFAIMIKAVKAFLELLLAH
jgi:hypothetical protein